MKITLSAYWSDALEAAIKEASTVPYLLSFGMQSEDYRSFEKAIAQGIDSHLEVVSFKQNGMTFTVSPDTMHVLVRRLMTQGDETDENSEAFGTAICETLGIELV